MQMVRSVDPTMDFPPLLVLWSPNNVDVDEAGGAADYNGGRAGGTHYRPSIIYPLQTLPAVYLLGEENVNTDEYDRMIVGHEWGHYFEANISRYDGPGGYHTLGEQLDMRLAFSEGFVTALSAMITGETIYIDSLGPRQSNTWSFSVENVETQRPGWFSEDSMLAIVFDLLDPIDDDQIELGFKPVLEAFVNDLPRTPAFVSIFPFIHALKTNLPHQAAAIDVLVGSHRIEPIIDEWGSTETNSGYPPNPDILPVYSRLTVNGGPVNVCSISDFSRMVGNAGNNLGTNRYLWFSAAVEGDYRVSATATSAPQGERADPIINVYRRGEIIRNGGFAPKADCTPNNISNCVEAFSNELSSGTYVLEVSEAANHGTGQVAGRRCFDVEVTSP